MVVVPGGVDEPAQRFPGVAVSFGEREFADRLIAVWVGRAGPVLHVAEVDARLGAAVGFGVDEAAGVLALAGLQGGDGGQVLVVQAECA